MEQRPLVMDNTTIVIRGAREHNLQNVDLDLPRNQLIVFTGVSGSGKSSLAFDTLYAEGQRRYVESLSSYARQFLGQMQKPDVDYLGGLSPAISIQQKTASRNPRSTVGTITEIFDYLRVLYARVGQGHCPRCQRPITAQTREQILARILTLPPGTRFLVLAPVVRGQKGEYRDLFADMLRRGFLRARVDGQVVRLTDDLQLDRRIKHDIEIVIDRLKNDPTARSRIAEAVEQALHLGDGSLIVAVEAATEDTERIGDAVTNADSSAGNRESRSTRTRGANRMEPSASSSQDILFSAHYACTHCNVSYEPPSPQLFSFNSPHGMCLECDGLGTRYSFDPDLLVPDPSKSLYSGAIPLIGPIKDMGRWRKHIYQGVCSSLGIDLRAPWSKLPQQHRDWLLFGSGDTHITWEYKRRFGKSLKHGGKWQGIVPDLLAQFKKVTSGPRRLQLEKYMRVLRCPSCSGQRLNPQARAVRVGGLSLVEACALPISELAAWLRPDGPLERSLSPLQHTIAIEVLKELRGRVGFLLNVGLHYLTLDRSAPTLSGGEAQRIRLAGQIGCGLVGVLYILDEPSIGLHPRDNDRLLRSLLQLRDMGNTVLVVEHDEDTMRAADYIVDFGPGPGVRGGQVVASGTFDQVVASGSLTGQYLAGTRQIPIPDKRRPLTDRKLTIVGARHHNLKNITVDIPLGVFVCVTGVSGSGKSSLINDILREGLRVALRNTDRDDDESEEEDGCNHTIGAHDRIDGIEQIDKVIDIDQSPIGRTPRSNPATYIKVFDEIRALFAQMTDSRVRGYTPGRFSFNKPGGRCEACEGNGSNRLEMDFLADVWVTCPVCEGRRFNRETLQVKHRGKTIHDVLEMDVQQALDHFQNISKIRTMLQTLHDVGLDYIKLGQPAPTLSGGEAQRVKLARELCRRATGRTLYILDEPTTGLHFEDIQKLLKVLHGFVEAGNTVVVIEHNLDVIKSADWVIDMGPEAGPAGGTVVVQGRPEDIVRQAQAGIVSHTAIALAPVLRAGPVVERPRYDPLKALQRREGDIEIDEVGKGAAMPWEVDGFRWHTVQRVSHHGKPCLWEGDILPFVDELVHAAGDFGETNWSERSVVEIPGPPGCGAWFVHMMTAEEKLVRLVFRVGKRTFQTSTLIEQLGIRPLNETEGLTIYGEDERVWVTNHKGPWQSVTIKVFRKSEIDTPAFRAFVAQAVQSFHHCIRRAKQKPEDLMPWKLHGKRWHLGDKGFPPGRQVRWDRQVLQRLLALIREIEPQAVIEYDQRDFLKIRVPGVQRAWAYCRTKEPEALDCRFRVKKGQINLAALEGLGTAQIDDHRADADTLRLRLTDLDAEAVNRLRTLLAEQLVGLRQAQVGNSS